MYEEVACRCNYTATMKILFLFGKKILTCRDEFEFFSFLSRMNRPLSESALRAKLVSLILSAYALLRMRFRTTLNQFFYLHLENKYSQKTRFFLIFYFFFNLLFMFVFVYLGLVCYSHFLDIYLFLCCFGTYILLIVVIDRRLQVE